MMKLAAALLLLSSVSYAYIPPTDYILKTSLKKKSSFKSFKIRSVVVGLSGDKPSGAKFKQVTWVDAQAGILRSRAYNDAGAELFGVDRKLSANIRDALLFSSNVNELAKLLHQVKIPARTDSSSEPEDTWLSRWKSTIAWVMGPKAQKNSPQLWVEKDTFLPIRYLGPAGEEIADLRLENYRYYKEFPYPRLISAAHGDTVILREEVSEVTVNADVSDLEKTQVAGTYTDAGNSTDLPVRDLIRNYYELVR